MKKTVLVTGGTSNDAPAMAVLLLNLKKLNRKLTDDLIIFHDGISEHDQTIMKKILPVQFRLYKYPGNNENFNNTVKNYFSTMIFCKYECFNLLNEYSVVIWTDYDVIINNDISELLIPTLSGFRMMPDIKNNVYSMFFKDISNLNIKYDFNVPGICMSIFVFFDNIKYYNEYYNYCLEQTEKYAPYLYLPEQCIINLLLQDYNIKIDPIDYNTYCTHPIHAKITKSTKIIHAFGQPKFWNGLYNIYWKKYYKKWIIMGGNEFSNEFGDKKKYLYHIKKIIMLLLPCAIYEYTKNVYHKIIKKL
jgi:lipopolysaccharide biosynthesis glycosyltransferase